MAHSTSRRTRTLAVTTRPSRATHPTAAAHLAARDPLYAHCQALDERRRALGCSQVMLGRTLGVSRSTIARMLNPAHANAAALRRVDIALTLLARAPSAAGMPVALNGRAVAGARASRTADRRVTRETAIPMTRLAATGAPNLASFRLLVAEDDSATIELYRMVLGEEQELRYDVTLVATPEECLRALTDAPHASAVDVLLMDLGLADSPVRSTGSTVLQHLIAHPADRPRDILVVSGMSPYQLETKRAQLATIGARYLPKPFDVEDLLTVVRALCLGQPVCAPATDLTVAQAM